MMDIKKILNEPVLYMFRKTWRFSEGNRLKVIFYLCCFIISNSIYLLWPLVMAEILNLVQTGGMSLDNLPKIILLLSSFVLITLGFWLFHGPARVIEHNNAFLVRAKYKKYLLDGVMNLPAAWHTNHHSGDTIDRIEKSSRALHDFAHDTYEVIETVVQLIGAYIALIYFNVHSSYFVITIGIMAVIVILLFDRVLIRQYYKLNREENKISAKIYDTVGNITTVIILRIAKLLSKSIWKRMIAPYNLSSQNVKIDETKWFVVSILTSLMFLTVMGSYIVFELRAGAVILVGTLAALYGYIDMINHLFFRFAYRYGDIVKFKTAMLNGEEIAVQFEKLKKVKTVNLPKAWKEISVNGLSFSYTGASKDLSDVSLSFRHGEKIALVGESGSGKTTFMKIMRNLYSMKSGKVFVDGEKLIGGFAAIGPSVSLIPQEPEIFATNILENITMGVRHPFSVVKVYTDMAEFTRVANGLPNKFKSSIVEKGVNLSGGQKQRLALARGLLASVDKEIVLLDESTSSVDTLTERKIYHNIFKKFRNKTIIVSVHRLHLLPEFDRIMYFSKGKLIGVGTLLELRRSSRSFANLWHKYKNLK